MARCFCIKEIPVAAVDGSPVVIEAELIRQNGPWRYFRDPVTGREWHENGWLGWYWSREEALRAYLPLKYDSADADFTDILVDRSPEARLHQLVAACVMLAKEWKKEQ